MRDPIAYGVVHVDGRMRPRKTRGRAEKRDAASAAYLRLTRSGWIVRRAWCEAGYLDFVCPMDYESADADFSKWVRASASRFIRASVTP